MISYPPAGIFVFLHRGGMVDALTVSREIVSDAGSQNRTIKSGDRLSCAGSNPAGAIGGDLTQEKK